MTKHELLAQYEERWFVRFCAYDADYLHEYALMEEDNEPVRELRDALRRACSRALRWHDAIQHLPVA